MRRVVWTVTLMLGLCAQVFAAYDGPFPVPLVPQYDRTDTGVRVRLTTQTKVLNGGRSHFLATVDLPAGAGIAGDLFTLQLWKYEPDPLTDDELIDNTCTHTLLAGEVASGASFTCDVFQQIPGTVAGSVDIYPRVVRNPGPSGVVAHEGANDRLTLPVVGDDAYEGTGGNNSFLKATPLTPTAGVTHVETDLVLGLNWDYFRFDAPAGVASADVMLEFWNGANDLDLFIYDSNGVPIAGSQTSNDVERVIVPITPFETYFIEVSVAETVPAFYDMSITLGGAHEITGTPTATPSPVASGGTLQLNANGTDSFGHTLSHQWQHVVASCASGAGTFSSLVAENPTWTAPVNTSGGPRTCTLRVTLDDGIGLVVQNDVVVTVLSQPGHTLGITSGPSGSPVPVSPNTVVPLSVTATDSLGHTVSYAWQSSCPTLAGNGMFSNAAEQNPTWTAPANATGQPRPCTLTVTASDGQGLTATASFVQTVNSIPHTLTITAGPSGTPNPVASGGTVNQTVTANDSLSHALNYAWSAACPALGGNGSFVNGTSATPTWTAPSNLTGSPQACTIQVVVDDGASGLSQTASYQQTVDSVAHTLTITAGPSGTPNPVDGASALTASVSASDSLNHTLQYAWTASCPTLGDNGAFSDPTAASPVWTAPANPGSQTDCTIAVSVTDGQGLSANGSYVQSVANGTGPTAESVYYFAEGATINGFFETRFALLNRDATIDANVTMEFQLKDTATVLTYPLVVPAHTRATVNVSTLGGVDPALATLASAEFSTVIRSDRPLVADRTMTWDGSGYGSHAETSIAAPASEWYLAEGATIGNFELYYLIQNPNNVALDHEIEVTYLLPPPAVPIVRTYSMGANTRTNIPVHLEPGLEDVEVSAIIRTPGSKPVIVERAMYLTTGGLFYGAGHESAGITAPATQWFFAEGATGDFFDLFILIGNPNLTTANVTATFLFDDGTTCSTPVEVGAQSRANIWVDTVEIAGCPRSLADAAVSTTITSDLPVVAERAMWWPGPTAASWAEAHNAAGATTTGIQWGLADGEQGGARANETYILIANTSAYAGTARVTLYREDGAMLTQDVPLAANSRTNVAVGADFGAPVADTRFGAVVTSLPVVGQAGPAQIVVERAMYSNGPGAAFWAAGTDALGTKLQ